MKLKPESNANRYIVTGKLDGVPSYMGYNPHFAFHKMDLWTAFAGEHERSCVARPAEHLTI